MHKYSSVDLVGGVFYKPLILWLSWNMRWLFTLPDFSVTRQNIFQIVHTRLYWCHLYHNAPSAQLCVAMNVLNQFLFNEARIFPLACPFPDIKHNEFIFSVMLKKIHWHPLPVLHLACKTLHGWVSTLGSQHISHSSQAWSSLSAIFTCHHRVS